jgi:phage terminase large subunit
LYGVRIYQKQDTAVTSLKARDIAREEAIAYSHCLADEDGIGGAVVDNNKGFKGFIANSAALDNPVTHQPENYANLKAQCSYKIAERINTHQIAVDIQPEDFKSEVPGITYQVWKDQLIEELEQIKSKDIDKDTKLRIISKEDMKEVLGRSPDFYDTLMMRAYYDYKQGMMQPAHVHYAQGTFPMQNNTSEPHMPKFAHVHTPHIPKRTW